MPESVLGIELTVFKDGIPNVLKGIFALHAHTTKMQVCGTHHEVFALGAAVLHPDFPYGPAEFRGNNIAASHFYFTALPQRFDTVKFAVRNLDVIRIP